MIESPKARFLTNSILDGDLFFMAKQQPLVSGFTFIKHGLSLGYPIKESIDSISPLCDEVIINVGFDDPNLEEDDGTWQYLQDNFPDDKYTFLKSYWDPEKMSHGLILSEQTNIALNKCRGEICFYIQGDETIHQDDYSLIEDGIDKMKNSPNLQGLIFNYLHFYGNVNIIKYTRSIYRREVRIIRNHIGLKSYLDAQGFRFENGEKPLSLLIKARIFHYGWARSEKVMSDKVQVMDRFYHGKNHQGNKFKYQRIWGLKPFKQTHPQFIQQWIEKNRNDLDIMSLKLDFKWKDISLVISDLIENLTNFRLGEFKNYKIAKREDYCD